MKEEAWIIDDNNTYVFGAKRFIELVNGCKKVNVFSEAPRATKQLKKRIQNKEQLPDVILLDINMPVVQGWFFLYAIQDLLSDEMKRNVRIYVVTSSISELDRLKALSYPIVREFVNKPLNLEKIRSIMAA